MSDQVDIKNILIISKDEILEKDIRSRKANMPVNFSFQKGSYEALQVLRLKPQDMVFVDYEMPLISGTELVKLVHKTGQSIPIIVIKADLNDLDKKEIISAGAVDYLEKPAGFTDIETKITNLLFSQSYLYQVEELRKKLKQDFGLENIIGDCEEMWQVFHELKNISNSDVTVFINGASGTGKEIIARAIHGNGLRKDKPLTVLNCAAIPENLLESELFGHEKGAFSGAVSQRQGRFEVADKGTIFLDEIGEMSLFTQSKILRVIEEQAFERVGGNKTIRVDVRIITATNKNLEEEVIAGNFREDLYYRINVYPIKLPPLKDRIKDVPLLVFHFIEILGKKNNKEVLGITKQALELLQAYSWPGNIRELENILERAVLKARGKVLTVEELSHLNVDNEETKIVKETVFHHTNGDPSTDNIQSMQQVETNALINALKRNQGNITKTAKQLEIGRATLHRKIKEYKINVSDYREIITNN